jgi:hypothetical protein
MAEGGGGPAVESAAADDEGAAEEQRSRERIAALRRRIAACEGIISNHLAQQPVTSPVPSHTALASAEAVGALDHWYQLTPTGGGAASEAGEDRDAKAAAADAKARLGFGAPPGAEERWYNLADAADRAAFAAAASPDRLEEVAEALREEKRKLVEKTVGVTLSRLQLSSQLGRSRTAGQLEGWPQHEARGGGGEAVTEGGGGGGGADVGRGGKSHRHVSRQF